MAPPRAFICGLVGTRLTQEERAFLSDAQPWGVILFRRNIGTSGEIRALCSSVRDALGRDAPVLIDQEGGSVQRIRSPITRNYPAGAVYGRIYANNPLLGVEAARLGARLIAADLAALGITINCVPVLDVPAEGVTAAIRDRTLGITVDSVSTLGRAQIDGMLAGGLLPVMKHMPGHGRATVDSHERLPWVDATVAEMIDVDFAPFRLWAKACPLAMTAHVVYVEIDPRAPATLSSVVIGKIIRERIGFHGVLMTDDISMGALSGDMKWRAGAALSAGCDLVLHCNGDLAEMQSVADAAPELVGEGLRRTDAALAARRAAEPFNRGALAARLDELLATVSA